MAPKRNRLGTGTAAAEVPFRPQVATDPEMTVRMGAQLTQCMRACTFCKDVVQQSLNLRDKITELGDNVVRSLEAQIIEVVAIKREDEDVTHTHMPNAALAEYYRAGRAGSFSWKHSAWRIET